VLQATNTASLHSSNVHQRTLFQTVCFADWIVYSLLHCISCNNYKNMARNMFMLWNDTAMSLTYCCTLQTLSHFIPETINVKLQELHYSFPGHSCTHYYMQLVGMLDMKHCHSGVPCTDSPTHVVYQFMLSSPLVWKWDCVNRNLKTSHVISTSTVCSTVPTGAYTKDSDIEMSHK